MATGHGRLPPPHLLTVQGNKATCFCGQVPEDIRHQRQSSKRRNGLRQDCTRSIHQVHERSYGGRRVDAESALERTVRISVLVALQRLAWDGSRHSSDARAPLCMADRLVEPSVHISTEGCIPADMGRYVHLSSWVSAYTSIGMLAPAKGGYSKQNKR